MRKRAQRKTTAIEPIDRIEKTKTIERKIKLKKNWWISFALVTIFFMVLFFNSYFNIISQDNVNPEGDSLSTTYYLSGPDPYYNMRLVEETVRTGSYPFYDDEDPILNYPLGRNGGRAPLLNMMAIGFSRFLTPFMSESDALGYSMQFVPALFGALLVFPVYFIGKTLFGRKEGLLAALLVALVPIHVGSGHGSAYGLFDHDSFNLLLFFLTFLFLIISIKEKNTQRSILFALLAGTSLAALNMVWVQAQFLFTVIAVYAVVQMLVDIFNNKMNWRVVSSLVIILFTGYLISLPVIAAREGFRPDLQLLLAAGVAVFGLIYIFLDKKKIPWVVSLPSIFFIGGLVLAILYFIDDLKSMLPFLSPLERISGILYGSGIYGNKVDLTIAEAGTANISKTVMSYGPALYWLAWAGLVLLLYYYFKEKQRRDYLFIFILFVINIWLAGTAGRFLNDIVPLIALLSGWIIWLVIEKLDYKQMMRNIRNAGGGLRGIRKGIKVYNLLGIFFVIFLIMMPNSFLTLDAAVPSAITKNGTSNMKIDYFDEDFSGAFGGSSYKEQYWIDAFNWLNDQDIEIEDPTKRPAFISWWDYGFYESAVGAHPTVADNFQDGIPPAANFHTAKSEKEAVAVWITRLLEGNKRENDGQLSTNVIETIQKHMDENDTIDIVNWIENPTSSPSYLTTIGEEYDAVLSKNVFVGEQWPENAVYHDITELLNTTLDDEGITWLYHDLQEATGYCIRYYGVEGYDVSIFNIFAFLADKSIVLYAIREAGGTKFPNPEDDFIKIIYSGYHINTDGSRGEDAEWTAEELNEMSDADLRRIAVTDTPSQQKPDYFKTMFFRTYIGNIPEGLEEQISQLPCWDMKHFSAEFISTFPYYGSPRGAVVIAKYYEGAKINGKVDFMNESLTNHQIIVTKDIIYGITPLPIDHDKSELDNKTYSVIAPAGNISLQIRRNLELGSNAFVVKTITLNSTTDPELAPITKEEAMRLEDSNYERTINISIEPASVSGYVYKNIDNDTEFNSSVDEPLVTAFVTLAEIEEVDTETGQPLEFGEIKELSTNEDGYYKASGLKPGIYLIRATRNDEFVIHEGYAFVYSGNNTYDVIHPELASIEGIIYFDENENNEYDTGEEIEDATVPLIYIRPDDTRKLVEQVKTNETGKYSFTDKVPGSYVLNPAKTNATNILYQDYVTEEPVTLRENETTILNISLDYAPIIVSGLTTHQDELIKDVIISFAIDESVENNTARFRTATSDENGEYSIDVIPGYYNVTVDASVDQGEFTFEGKLHLKLGEGEKSYNISLTKTSYTVSGSTKFNDVSISNISVRFSPDTTVENNTAKTKQTRSDENGLYAIELTPGTYIVSVEEIVNESGVEVTYAFSGFLKVNSAKTYNIALTKEET